MENGDYPVEIEDLPNYINLSPDGLDRGNEVLNDQNSVDRMQERLKEISPSAEFNDQNFVDRVQRRLNETSQDKNQRRTSGNPVCIYRVPRSLAGIKIKAVYPEIVSIGPFYHRKYWLRAFDSYKWRFLDSLTRRTELEGVKLWHYTAAMKELEPRARRCYSESFPMSNDDFIEMMLLDGCFIVELFQQFRQNQESEAANSLIFTMPASIPTVIGDLLKLENQLPFFVLKKLFDLCTVKDYNQGDCPPCLPSLALKFFNLALPRPLQTVNCASVTRSDHLLDLFHSCYLSSAFYNSQKYRPYDDSDQSIQCVTRLRQAGIKFRPRKTGSLLEISFQNGLLEIPPITINDFTTTVFLNCVALEQCRRDRTTFSTYIAFLSCLINSGKDVAFLCEEGIVNSFSQNDQHVAELFKNLGEKVVFDIRDCYLSEQFRELEAYYSGNWATLRRTYFRTPWSFISVVSAFVLLLFTGVQTLTAIWSLFR